MLKRKTVYMELEPRTKQVLRVASAQAGVTQAEYVSNLIEADAKINGVADLVDRPRGGEVRHGK